MCGSGDLTSVRIEKPQRWSRDGQPPERSMIDVDEESLRAGLFPLVDLTQVSDFSCRNADGLQLRQQFFGPVGPEDHFDQFVDLLTVLDPFRVGRHTVCIRVDPKSRAETFPQTFTADCDLYGTVYRRK